MEVRIGNGFVELPKLTMSLAERMDVSGDTNLILAEGAYYRAEASETAGSLHVSHV